MQTWMIYAILSMIFAGITSVLAKYGLQNVSADFGLGVRTTVIFVIIAAMNLVGTRTKNSRILPIFSWHYSSRPASPPH